jgi:hypothetical protein
MAMVTYKRLLKKPQVAKSLIGLSLVEFDELYVEFEIAHTERLETSTTRRRKQKRRRAAGAGRKHKYDLRDRLLMTLFPWHRPPGQVWLKAYTTYELLGFFYDLNKTNIEDNLKLVLATLEGMTSFNFERPTAERQKLRSVAEVMDAFQMCASLLTPKNNGLSVPGIRKTKTATCQTVKSRTILERRKPIRSRIRQPLRRLG